ncbi:MAG: peptidase [Clostridia bacterium]
MELEKAFREAVREAGDRIVGNARMNPGLEKRIRHSIEQGKRKQQRGLFMSTAVVACLVVAFVIMSPLRFFDQTGQEETSSLPTTAQPQVEQPRYTKEWADKAVQPLMKAVPQLDGFRMLTMESSPIYIGLQLRNHEDSYAYVTFNNRNGELETFALEKPRLATEKAPSRDGAVQKATSFLRALLGEASDNYAVASSKEVSIDGLQNARAINVTFQNGKKKAAPPDTISVWVDGAGQVIAFNRINEQEQALLERLQQAIPGFGPELVLKQKRPHGQGYTITVENTNEQNQTVLISTSGNKSGETLIGFSYENQAGRGNRPSAEQRAAAVGKATDFLQQILGKDSASYKPISYYEPTTFQRYHNGLPVLGDQIQVFVDDKGSVQDFQKREEIFDPASFPDPAEAISVEQAEHTLQTQMKLRYIELFAISRDPKSRKPLEIRPLLEYTPAISSLQMGRHPSQQWMIDAKTGRMKYGLGSNGMDYDRHDSHPPFRVNAPKQYVTVSSKAEAEHLLLTAMGANLKDLTYQESTDPRGMTVYQWTTKEDRAFRVTTDANNGRVVEISKPRVDTANTVSEQEARQAALSFLERFIDPGVEEVQLSQVIVSGEGNPVRSGDWEFEFLKSHDGIPVIQEYPNEAYIVTVDPSTGKANGFLRRSEKWEQATDLPDRSKVVSVQEAVAEYVKYLPLQLAYTVRDESGDRLAAPALVYVPMSEERYAEKYIHLDAISGKVVMSP